MKIQLHNIDPAGVATVVGPHVNVILSDSGQAHVSLTLAISDGTNFSFPDTAGRHWPQTTMLPPGDHACTVVVAALGHGGFGRSYDCGVVIGDRLVATAEGAIPTEADSDLGLGSFILRVV